MYGPEGPYVTSDLDAIMELNQIMIDENIEYDDLNMSIKYKIMHDLDPDGR